MLTQALWVNIWKRTVEKNQTNAIDVTIHNLKLAIWGDIVNTHWRKVKQKQTMQLWIVLSKSLQVLVFPHSKAEWMMTNRCSWCEYAFSQASNLRRHLKTHNGEKSNNCRQCNFVSSCLNALIHAFENTQWMMTIRCRLQLMYICLLWGKRFEESFVNTLEKSQTNADNATLYCLV